MQHRPQQHRSYLPETSSQSTPLLPPLKHHDLGATIRISPAQLQQVGAGLLVVLLLFVGSNYVRHYLRLQRHDLSSCSDRLAALGFTLDAASLSAGASAGRDRQLPTDGGGGGNSNNAVLLEHALQRQALYGDLSTEMQRRGLLLGGVVTQGLRQEDLFETIAAQHRGGRVVRKAKLTHLATPVRAAILPVTDDEAALQLQTTLRHALHNVLAPDSVWWQEPHLMHATLWHASTQQDPVAATPQQLAAEEKAVAGVARSHCPLHAVLDRVVVTSSGVVMACWQLLPGSTEVAVLRQALHAALPHAPPPGKQHVRHPAILHTTIARLLAPARRPDTAAGQPGQPWPEDAVFLQSALVDAIDDVSDELCGLVMTFGELAFVEERDVLALALNGHFSKHVSRLRCQHPPAAAAAA